MARKRALKKKTGLKKEEEETFTIDCERTEVGDEVEMQMDATTRRQKAFLHSRRTAKNRLLPDVKPPVTTLKRPFPAKNTNRSRLAHKKTPLHTAGLPAYDLWNTELNDVVDLREDLADYYLRQTRRRLPREPPSLKAPTTILPKVDMPNPGTSYNPSYKHHQQLLQVTLEKELKVQKELARIDRLARLKPGQRYVTAAEKLNEELSGLVKEEEEEQQHVDTEEPIVDEKYRPETAPISSENRKLAAARRREIDEKKKLAKIKTDKLQKKLLSDVFRAKRLQRKVEKEQKDTEDRARRRAVQKKLVKLTTPNQLGKGKYEEEEEPFLLTEELVGSLRELKPVGDLLSERMKSLQKRNMLPIAGEKQKRKLKKKLKVKWTEKRSHQEVTVGSRVL